VRRIVETSLVASAGRLDKIPEPSHPEVAFAGRSNVGKSSLLNALAGRRGLFKVSQTPGRTRTIVHVEARLDDGARIYLVDLPGYGYAKVAKGAKERWSMLMEEYLGNRPTLHLVVVLVDVRRGIEEEEADLLHFLADAGVPAMLAATKLDKLGKARRAAALEVLRRASGAPVVGTAATEKLGMEQLLARILEACGV